MLSRVMERSQSVSGCSCAVVWLAGRTMQQGRGFDDSTVLERSQSHAYKMNDAHDFTRCTAPTCLGDLRGGIWGARACERGPVHSGNANATSAARILFNFTSAVTSTSAVQLPAPRQRRLSTAMRVLTAADNVPPRCAVTRSWQGVKWISLRLRQRLCLPVATGWSMVDISTCTPLYPSSSILLLLFHQISDTARS